MAKWFKRMIGAAACASVFAFAQVTTAQAVLVGVPPTPMSHSMMAEQ